MSTENGLAALSTARDYIETLRRRVEFLDERIQERLCRGLDASHSSYDIAEVAALRWALPILEVEWDVLARQRRTFELQSTGARPPNWHGQTISESLRTSA